MAVRDVNDSISDFDQWWPGSGVFQVMGVGRVTHTHYSRLPGTVD